jgi:predicted HTH transcriptional regulator
VSHRRDFGETSERLRRGFGDKSALLLFIISLNNTITAKEASEYLQVTPRTIETYFAKLKEKGVLERKGADFGGEWVIK